MYEVKFIQSVRAFENEDTQTLGNGPTLSLNILINLDQDTFVIRTRLVENQNVLNDSKL